MAKKTVVLNLKALPATVKNGVYIGRGSDWGNPFVIGKDGTREQVLAKFKQALWRSPAMMARLPELRGKSLLCWCSPEGCHGDVLVAALAWQDAEAKQDAAKKKQADQVPAF